MNFGDKLKQYRLEKNMSQEELANKLNTTKQVISRYENNQRTPKLSVAIEISARLGVPLNYLVDNNIPADNGNIIPLDKAKRIPLLGRIACGEPILAQENWEELILLPDNIQADFALRCQGDSMKDARINEGDIVFIKMQAQVDNGEVAAVLVDDEATLKRFYQQGDKVILQPENKDYQPYIYVGNEINDIRIIGKATYFLSKVE